MAKKGEEPAASRAFDTTSSSIIGKRKGVREERAIIGRGKPVAQKSTLTEMHKQKKFRGGGTALW